MSDVFDLDTDGQAALEAQARSNPIPADQLDSGFWHGVPKAIGMGVMRGGAHAAHAIGLAGGGLLSLVESSPGQLVDPYFRSLDKYVGEAVDYWTPGANEVGTAGKILGGFSEMALPLMATGGNPSLMIASTELEGASQLAKQGASTTGAVAGGVIEGLANAAGFKIPFLGKTLATRVLSGMAGNAVVGAGGSSAEKAALNLTGDQAQADEIHPLDAQARLVDILSGAVFGGIAHFASPTVRDAVSTAANAKHFQNDTAPGTPGDIRASAAHQAAIEEGINAILEDRALDLSETGVQEANFLHDRQLPEMPDAPEEAKGVDDAIKEAPAQNPERVEPPREAPIAQFRRDAAAIEGSLPLVDEGNTRLWRGNRPGEIGQNPQFTNSLAGIALPFRKGYGGEISYVDVPSERLAEFENKGAAAPGAEFILPKELATKAIAATEGGKPMAKVPLDPVVAAAHEALDKSDIQVPTGDLREDGTAITASARDLMAQLTQAVATARNDARAFEALSNCILFRGN